MDTTLFSIIAGWVFALIFFVMWLFRRSAFNASEEQRRCAASDYVMNLNNLEDRWARNAVNAGVAHWEVDKYGGKSFHWSSPGNVLLVTSADLTGYPIQSGEFRVTPDMLRVDKARLQAADLVLYLGLADSRFQVIKQRYDTLLESVRALG